MNHPELPVEVGNDEWIERMFDRGCKRANGTVKWQALRLGKNETGASVVRLRMSEQDVKRTGRDNKNGYAGFLETRVATIRELGHEVIDYRRDGEYYGHAEIEYTDCPPRPVLTGDPEKDDQMVDEEKDFYEALLPFFLVLVDSEPNSNDWHGSPMGEFQPPSVATPVETDE